MMEEYVLWREGKALLTTVKLYWKSLAVKKLLLWKIQKTSQFKQISFTSARNIIILCSASHTEIMAP